MPIMYKQPKLGCSDCGQIVGHSMICSKHFKIPLNKTYDQGYQDGRDSVIPKPMFIGCSECGQISGHTYSCSKNPIDLRSDYQKGFDDGERSAGSSGDNGFEYGGE
jgi:hypothetical protein